MPGAIGVICQVLLGVAGVLVTLHEDWAKRHRNWVISAFALVSSAGAALTLKAGHDAELTTAKAIQAAREANTKLGASLEHLTQAAHEITRVEGLNGQLQQRLLASSATIAGLARSGISTSTGGNSIGYVRLAFHKTANTTASIVLLQRGQYPLYDVSVHLVDSDNFSLSTEYPTYQIGTLAKHGARLVGEIPVENAAERRLVALFSARNGAWDQLILLRQKAGKWFFATRIQKNSGQVRFANLNDPPLVLFQTEDKGFPGTIRESEWASFNGMNVWCSDCQ